MTDEPQSSGKVLTSADSSVPEKAPLIRRLLLNPWIIGMGLLALMVLILTVANWQGKIKISEKHVLVNPECFSILFTKLTVRAIALVYTPIVFLLGFLIGYLSSWIHFRK